MISSSAGLVPTGQNTQRRVQVLVVSMEMRLNGGYGPTLGSMGGSFLICKKWAMGYPLKKDGVQFFLETPVIQQNFSGLSSSRPFSLHRFDSRPHDKVSCTGHDRLSEHSLTGFQILWLKEVVSGVAC
jgi:hypothetical protein